MSSPHIVKPDLADLIHLFYPRADDLGQFTRVERYDLPPHYRELLAHQHHMTIAVEAHHQDQVGVEVLRSKCTGEHYSREIVLRTRREKRVVQYGIMRTDLSTLPARARDEIKSESTPLGRVLIQNCILRRIDLTNLYHVEPGSALCGLLELDRPQVTFGRTALIYCNEEPAIELIEIVIPADE